MHFCHPSCIFALEKDKQPNRLMFRHLTPTLRIAIAILLLTIPVIAPHHHHGEAICYAITEEADVHEHNCGNHSEQEKQPCGGNGVYHERALLLPVRTTSDCLAFTVCTLPETGNPIPVPHSHLLREACLLPDFLPFTVKRAVNGYENRGPPCA